MSQGVRPKRPYDECLCMDTRMRHDENGKCTRCDCWAFKHKDDSLAWKYRKDKRNWGKLHRSVTGDWQ